MVKVIVRTKPIPPNRVNCMKKLSHKKLILNKGKKEHLYNVDYIYERVDNRGLFFQLYDAELNKSNVLLAYGQSGSGKTYSIFGNEETNGLLTILCRRMYAKYREFYIMCYEVYNNVMYDLLDKEQKLKYYSYSNFIDKRKKYIINDVADYLGIVDMIQERRKQSSTSLNSRSSRSHCVIEIFRGETKFTLIDLAGSEQKRYDKENSSADKHERKNINKDLFAIKEILRTEKTKKIGNYHHSKIACVIKHAFKKSKSVNILCTIIPAKKYAFDTFDSLNYCTLLKKPLITETSIVKYNPIKTKENNINIKIKKKEFSPRKLDLKVKEAPNFINTLPKFLEPILKLKLNDKLDIHKPILPPPPPEEEPPPLIEVKEEKKIKPVPREIYNFDIMYYKY